MKQVGWVRLAVIVVALAALAAVMAPSTRGGGHHRLVARIDQPFAINERLFPAGEISIRQMQRYSPSATLNQIWIDGECLGVFLAEVLAGDDGPSRTTASTSTGDPRTGWSWPVSPSAASGRAPSTDSAR